MNIQVTRNRCFRHVAESEGPMFSLDLSGTADDVFDAGLGSPVSDGMLLLWTARINSAYENALYCAVRWR